jgi:hypothetical protein
VKPLKINILQHGPACEHNMPCAICLTKHAVYNMDEGFFEPCWDCQKLGWLTGNLTEWSLWERIRGKRRAP